MSNNWKNKTDLFQMSALEVRGGGRGGEREREGRGEGEGGEREGRGGERGAQSLTPLKIFKHSSRIAL